MRRCLGRGKGGALPGTEGRPGEGWAELDENGWGALIEWAAGPENLRRGPLDDSTRTVTVTRTDKDGSVTGSVEVHCT